MGRTRLLVSDFVLSFMWVWSGVLIKIFVYKYLGLSQEPLGEIVKSALSIVNSFFFAILGKITRGAPSILSPFWLMPFLGISANSFSASVIGSIIGVKLMIDPLHGVGQGPRLNIDIHRDALTQSFLTFTIVIISLGFVTKFFGSFFMKTWISSVFKLSLHILVSDLTGGCMNPASVMGWAYARGDHITKEHIFVYWLAPIEASLLAMWTFKLLVWPVKGDKTATKSKSD